MLITDINRDDATTCGGDEGGAHGGAGLFVTRLKRDDETEGHEEESILKFRHIKALVSTLKSHLRFWSHLIFFFFLFFPNIQSNSFFLFSLVLIFSLFTSITHFMSKNHIVCESSSLPRRFWETYRKPLKIL